MSRGINRLDFSFDFFPKTSVYIGKLKHVQKAYKGSDIIWKTLAHSATNQMPKAAYISTWCLDFPVWKGEVVM